MTKHFIYKIECGANGRKYIGASARPEERWRGHLSQLRNGKHSIKPWQNDYDLYGTDAFVFEVVTECEENERSDVEAFYIQHFDAIGGGYNTARRSAQKFTFSEERKQALRERITLRNKTAPQTEYQRKDSGERLTIVNKTLPQSDERRRKAKERMARMQAEGRIPRPPPHDEGFRQRASERLKRMIKEGYIKTWSPEANAKRAASQTGKKMALSDEERQKRAERCRQRNIARTGMKRGQKCLTLAE